MKDNSKFKEVVLPNVLSKTFPRIKNFKGCLEYIDIIKSDFYKKFTLENLKPKTNNEINNKDILIEAKEIYENTRLESLELNSFMYVVYSINNIFIPKGLNEEEQSLLSNNMDNINYNIKILSLELKSLKKRVDERLVEVLIKLGISYEVVNDYIKETNEKLGKDTINLDNVNMRKNLQFLYSFKKELKNKDAERKPELDTDKETISNVNNSSDIMKNISNATNEIKALMRNNHKKIREKEHKLNERFKQKLLENRDNKEYIEALKKYIKRKAISEVKDENVYSKVKAILKLYIARNELKSQKSFKERLTSKLNKGKHTLDFSGLMKQLEIISKEAEELYNLRIDRNLKDVYNIIKPEENFEDFKILFGVSEYSLLGNIKMSRKTKDENNYKENSKNKNLEEIYSEIHTLDYEYLENDLEKSEIFKAINSNIVNTEEEINLVDIIKEIFNNNRVIFVNSKNEAPKLLNIGSGYIIISSSSRTLLMHELGHYIDYHISDNPLYSGIGLESEFYSQIFELDYYKHEIKQAENDIEKKRKISKMLVWLDSVFSKNLSLIALAIRIEEIASKKEALKDKELEEDIKSFIDKLDDNEKDLIEYFPFLRDSYGYMTYVITILMAVLMHERLTNSSEKEYLKDMRKKFISSMKLNKFLSFTEVLDYLSIDILGEDIKQSYLNELKKYLDMLGK